MISAFVLSRVRKAAYAVGAGLLAVMALVCWKPLIPGPEVVFIDVGHGDAIFARSPGGTTVLVDAGEASPVVDMGARIVAPFLWGSGVSHLDYVVVTHPDQDHIGGVFYILDHFSVGKVVLSGIASDRRLEVRLLKTCRSRGIPVERVFLGDTLQAKGAEIAVLHPDHASAPDCGVNDSSVVLRMTCRDETILLSGDIERAAESKVRATGCAAQVLKVPHHGSRTSSTDEFIDAVSPQFAVVSTGGERGREAVHPGVLRRYLERNIEVLRTDQLGGIRLSWKKGKVNLIGAREQRGYVHVPRPSPSQ